MKVSTFKNFDYVIICIKDIGVENYQIIYMPLKLFYSRPNNESSYETRCEKIGLRIFFIWSHTIWLYSNRRWLEA